jgi:hypothetical protein
MTYKRGGKLIHNSLTVASLLDRIYGRVWEEKIGG